MVTRHEGMPRVVAVYRTRGEHRKVGVLCVRLSPQRRLEESKGEADYYLPRPGRCMEERARKKMPEVFLVWRMVVGTVAVQGNRV